MRRTGRTRGFLGFLLVGGLLVAAAASIGAVLMDECYEDVRISGAGSNEVNGIYTFDRMQGRKPRFCKGPGCIASLEYKSEWTIVYNGVDMYTNCSCSSFKPTGWDAEAGEEPAPRVDGGGECVPEIDVVPAGRDGILDRGWPQGQMPPTVGERVVAAVYEIGEILTGCIQILDTERDLVTNLDTRLLLFRVTEIGEDSDRTQFIDSQVLPYDRERSAFCFSIRTDVRLNPGLSNEHIWSPGYYDIRLNYPDDSVEYIRIQLVEPPPDDQG